MKKYVKPTLLMVELRAEERLAGCDIIGDGFIGHKDNCRFKDNGNGAWMS